MGCCGRKSFTVKRNPGESIQRNRLLSIMCPTCRKLRYYRPGNKRVFCSKCRRFINI